MIKHPPALPESFNKLIIVKRLATSLLSDAMQGKLLEKSNNIELITKIFFLRKYFFLLPRW